MTSPYARNIDESESDRQTHLPCHRRREGSPPKRPKAPASYVGSHLPSSHRHRHRRESLSSNRREISRTDHIRFLPERHHCSHEPVRCPSDQELVDALDFISDRREDDDGNVFYHTDMIGPFINMDKAKIKLEKDGIKIVGAEAVIPDLAHSYKKSYEESLEKIKSINCRERDSISRWTKATTVSNAILSGIVAFAVIIYIVYRAFFTSNNDWE